MAAIAQLAEHKVVALGVTSSILVSRPKQCHREETRSVRVYAEDQTTVTRTASRSLPIFR